MVAPTVPELPPSPQTTLVVVLGASVYPRKPAWTNPVLGASAKAFREYVLAQMEIPTEHLLDLFDDDRHAASQCEEVELFLEQRSPRARDLIVYYVGHGGFDRDEYYLGVRATRENREFYTAIESETIARIIRERFGRKRVYVILDSCFAASAAKDFQGGLDAAVKHMERPLPKRGTAFLAAASKDSVALAPRTGTYTIFTGALIESLRRGVPGGAPNLSLYELYEEIKDTLNERVDLGEARPELHAPRQDDGDISRLPLFPNEAHRAAQRKRAAAEASARAAAEAEANARAAAETEANARAAAEAEADARAAARARVDAEARARALARAAALEQADEAPRPARRWLYVMLAVVGGGSGIVILAGAVKACRGADTKTVDTPIARSLDEEITAVNPFVSVRGVRLSSHQVSLGEYDLFVEHASSADRLRFAMKAPGTFVNQPVHSVTYEQASAFCHAIQAQLPSVEEWQRASGGLAAIWTAESAVAGPLREWTRTEEGKGAVVMGWNDSMSAAKIEQAKQGRLVVAMEAAFADDPTQRRDDLVSSEDIGFRCVR